MKELKRRAIGILLSILMVMQLCNVFAATLIDEIPSEVKNADGGFKKIPVVYNGKEVTQVDVFLEKANTTAANANERFNISGYATFYINSYVYKTGENIKIGTQFTYKDESGNWVKDWLDQSGQVQSDANWQTTDYKVNVDTIKFTELTSQDHNKRVNFITKVMNGSNKVGEFRRESSKNVAMSTADIVVTQDGLTISK